MKKLFILPVCCLAFIACQKKAEEAVKAEPEKKETCAKKDFKMYEMSEMAGLMEQMYADNMHLKERIVAGDTIGEFPQHFLKIHASVMTDDSDNDAFFKEQAAKFIKAQELIYKDSLNAKKHFNEAVATCVKCHEQKCEGPIPRIKKLYIK